MSETGTDNEEQYAADTFLTTAVTAIVFFRVLISGTVHPWTGYLLNAALGAAALYVLVRSPERLKTHGRLLRAGISLYFGAALVSIFFSIMPWNSLRCLLYHLGDLFLFFAVLAAGRDRLPAVAGAVLLAGAVSAAFALRQKFGGFAAAMQADGVTDFALGTLREGRVFGLTFSPDMMAAIIAGLMPVCLSFILNGTLRPGSGEGKRPLQILLFCLLMVLFATVLFLTRSVGGFLAAGAGVLIWLIFYRRIAGTEFRRRRALLVAASAFLIIAGAVAIIHLRGGHLFNIDDPNNPLVRRLDNWATGFKVWREFPVMGAGAGQYGLASLYHRSLSGNEAKHAHNLLIEALAETGPLGFAGLVLILAGFILGAVSLHKKLGPAGSAEAGGREASRGPPFGRDEIRVGLIAGAGAVALHSLIDFDFSVMEVAAIFWIGLAAAVDPVKAASPGASAGRRGPFRAITLAGLAVIVFVELYLAWGALLRERAQGSAREGDWIGARAWAGKAVAWSWTDDEMYALLARAVAISSEDKSEAGPGARAALDMAISLNPRYPYHYRDLGLLLLRTDRAAAGERFHKAVSLYPNNMGLNIHLGRWLRSEGRFDEAEQVLKHAVECHKNNGDALLELGVLYSVQGRHDQAGEYLERSAWRAPVSGQRAAAFSEFLVKQGKPKEAAEFLKKWEEQFK